MKTITMIVVVLFLVGCARAKTAEDRAKAEEYCRKYGQLEVVTLSAMANFSEAIDFGCRKPGDINYTLVPDYVYSESTSSK